MVKSALILLTCLTFLQGYFSQLAGTITQQVDLFDEIILLGLTFYWIGRILLGKAKFKRTPLDFILITIVLYVLISSLLNSHSPFISLLAIRDTFQYLIFFYILIQLEIKVKDLMILFKIIFIIAVLQFFVVMLQMGLNFSKTGKLFLEDLAFGTFGVNGAHKIGYFMGMMIVTSIVLYLDNRGKKYLISAFLFCLTLVISSCRGAYFITGLTLLFLYKGYILKNLKRFAMSFFILISLGLLIFHFNRISTGNIEMINPKTLFSQQLGLKLGTGRRIGVMYYFVNLLKNSEHVLLGVSPGILSKTSLYFEKSEIIREFESLYEGSKYVLIVNQLTATIFEYGIIGSIFIFFIFFRAYSINAKIAMKRKNRNINNFNIIFKGIFIIYLLGIFAEKVFEIQEISFYFWFLFSLIYLLEKNNGNHQIA